MPEDNRLLSPRFPRSLKYHPDWLITHAGSGAHTLWLTEWLTEAIDLRPGMRVLDLGCGKAVSSIFLHREFGVQVWAADLWVNASENIQRIRDAGVQDGVFPLNANARSLPFAVEFFDAILCIDSFCYYGTDDNYLSYLVGFVKPGGPIGVVGAGLIHEIDGPVPEHLREWWTQDAWCLHSADWLRRHWERTGLVSIETADTLPDGWRYWLDWHKTGFPDNTPEIKAIEADAGRTMGYIRVVGRRQGNVKPEEIWSPESTRLPVTYQKKPMLRET